MIGVNAQVKTFFFDRARVVNAVSAARRRVLSKAGAFIRRRAQTSMRRRKSVSLAGRPPHAHSGELRRLLYFAYDPSSEGVVIGPVRYRRGTVPSLMEFGGIAKVRDFDGKFKIGRYRPRPYMGPAFDAEIGKLPGLWRDSISR